jgi:serine/threonine-protein kinase
MKINLVGYKLGKYELTERVGRGGMAEVYKAYQPGLDRFVAVKVLTGYFADIPQFITRFKREARSIAQLRHSHIVQVFDFDVEDELYYMVMEYVQGGTLHQHIQQRGALPVKDVLRIGTALADALAYAHERGMIHRDIKPGNVLFADHSSAHPVLTDFGIARIVGETALTTSSGFLGTPGYVSPEIGRGEPADERSDVYSLGVMLYEMAAGRMPYYGDTPYAVIMKHVNEPLPSMRQFKPDVPDALEEVVYRALAKRADLRYQTAGDLRDALQEAHRAIASPPSAAMMRRAIAVIDTPVFEVETRALPPQALEPAPSEITADATPLTESQPIEDDTPKRRRRKSALFALGFVGAAVAAGMAILRGGDAMGAIQQLATHTEQPALVAPEESPTYTPSPTLTFTSSPTDVPPTATHMLAPTDTATRRPTRPPVTITNEPTDIPPTRTPSRTPLPPTATNTRVPPTNPPPPPPTSVPPTNPPPTNPPSGGGEQPPDNGQSNPIQDTVDTVSDTVGDAVDGVGDAVDDLTGGLGLP